MRKLSIILAAAICTAALPTAPAHAMASQREKASRQFEALWSQRYNEYVGQLPALAARHKAAIEAIVSKPFTFAPGDNRFDEMVRLSEDDARNSGRGQEIEGFLAHMKARPSMGISQAYLQGRVQKIDALTASANAAGNAVMAMASAGTSTYGQLFEAAEQAAMQRGEAKGRTDEMLLIIQNFGAYKADVSAASQRDAQRRARWGAALSAMGRSLSTPQPRPHFVNCTNVGGMVNCIGQ